MLKKLSVITILSIIHSVAFATNPTYNFIDNKDYAGLKKHLYISQPNVLERDQGYSSLDYAIAKRDKRAAIIIADYNNSSISQRRLRAVELELETLHHLVESQNPNSDEIMMAINQLESEKEKLRVDVSTESILAVEKKMTHLEQRIVALESMAMPLEIKKAALKSRNFFDESLILEKKHEIQQ